MKVIGGHFSDGEEAASGPPFSSTEDKLKTIQRYVHSTPRLRLYTVL